MATQVQFRRGTTAQNNNFTGAIGEISFDTDILTIRVHDGSLAGGYELARADLSNTGLSTENSSFDYINATSGLYVAGVSTFVGNVQFDGDITLGNATVDNIIFNGDVNSNIIPNADDTYDLGSLSQQWRNIYINGTADIDQLTVSGVSTFTGTVDANGDLDVNGHTELDDVNVSGMATVASLDVQTNFDVYDTTATFHNNVYVAGNLSIGGTTSALSAVDLKISDKDIVLGVTTDSNNNDISTDDTANHAGVAVASTEGSPLVDLFIVGIETLPVTYKKFMWFKEGSFSGLGTDAWITNYGVGIGSTQIPTGVRFAVSNIQFTDNLISSPQLSISGVSTFTGNVDANGDLDVNGHTELDDVNVSGIITAASAALTSAVVGGATTFTETLVVQGDARITGILTIGTSSVTIDGSEDSITIGTGVTLTDLGDANYSGIVTASKFSGNIDGNINSTGVSTFTTLQVGSAVTITDSGHANYTGVVTAYQIYANEQFYGNVSGDVVGDLFGNVSGNLSGNVNSSGISTFGELVIGTVSINSNNNGIVTATSFTGNLTGNVTGNVNGDVTGDLTGEVNATAFDTNPAGVVITGVATAPAFVGLVTGNVTGNINATSGINTLTNSVEIRSSDGSPGRIDYYCEVSNAHYTRVESAAHSEYTGNVTAKLPIKSGDLLVGDTDGAITQNVNTSGIITATTFSGDLSGNATTATTATAATALETARDFTVSGDVATASGVSFDGSGNADLPVTLSSSFSANTSGIVTAAEFSTGSGGIGINTNTISGPTAIFIDPATVGDNTGIVRIKGDLYVDGTQTILNSTQVEIADFVVGIATTAITDVAADGAGLQIGPDNTILYDHSNTALKSSENFNLASSKTYKINGSNVLSSTTLGSGVVNSSLTSVGTLGQLNVSGVTTATTLNSTNGTITNLSGTIGTVSNQLSVAGVLTATSGGFEMSVGIATINLLDVYQLTPDGSTSGTLNQVPVADGSGGWSWQPVSAAGASEIEGITIREEGSVVGTLSSITTVNFVGTNVTADAAELQGIATVTFTDRPTFLSINVTSGVGTVTDLESTNGTITNLSGTIGTVTTLESTNGTITNLSGTIGTVTTLTSTNGTITNLSSTNLSGTIGTVTTLTSTNGTVTNLSSTNLSGTIGTVTTLESTNGTITNLSSTNLSGTIGTVTTFESTDGTITNLSSTNLSGTIGTITSLNSTISTLTNVTVSGITTFTNSTQNTLGNPDTGAVQIDGGLGVNKNATIDGSLDVDGHTELDDVNVSGIATIQDIDVQNSFDVYATTGTFHNNVYIAGNLSIGGTSSSLQAVDLKIEDKDIVLGVTTDSNGEDVSTDDTANHGGIAIASTEGNPLTDLFIVGIETLPVTYKKFMWFKEGSFSGLNTDAWLSNYAVGIGSTQFATGTRLAAGQIQITENTINSPQLSISGVSTFSADIDADGNVDVAGTLDVDGHTELDDVNITGVATIGNVIVGGATTDLLVNGNARITGILTIGTGSITIDSATNFIGIGTNVPSGDSNSLSMFSEDSDPPGAGSFRIAGPLQKIVYNGLDVGLLSGTYSGGVYGLESSNSNSLVKVGILSATASSSLGIATANSLQVNGIGTITGDLQVSGVGTITGDAFVGSAITMYASAGIVSATSFFGDGSGLSNTGSTLSTLSGTERVVLTNLTSGTMTASSTDANLTFNSDGDVLQAGAAVTVYGTAGIVSATSFFGDGSGLSNTGSTLSDLSGTERIVLTSLTSGTMTSSSTDSNLTFNSTGDVLQAGVAVTVYGTAGIVSATSFFGDGSGLSNTGSTLSATSGTERVVLTNLTSGTMTASSTDADLTFDSVSNTLLATNLYVSGIATAATIDSSTFKNYAETVTDLGTLIDGTNDIDISNGNVFYGTLPTSGTVTFTFTTGLTAGAVSFTLYLKNGASGTPTLAWPAAVKFPGGSAPDRTTTADKTDIWTFSTFNNGTDWYGDIAMYNM